MNSPHGRTPASDQQHFERLYHEHVHVIASYLAARTDRDSAVDALARTFEIAWRRLPVVPVEPKPWLLAVARRVLADQRRSAGRQETLIDRIGETLRRGADDHAETLGAREALLAALRELAPDQREALLLVAWDGLSHREAAAVLDCSVGAVTLRVHRARRRLRAEMDKLDLQDVDGGGASVPPCPTRLPKEAL